LKGVQYINRPSQLNRVHRAEGVAPMRVDDLHNARAAKALQRFGVVMFAAFLRDIEGLAHAILHRVRKFLKILPA